MGIAKRFRNVQPDVPAYLYDWLDKNIPLQIVWVPEEMQYQPKFKEHIPTAKATRTGLGSSTRAVDEIIWRDAGHPSRYR